MITRFSRIIGMLTFLTLSVIGLNDRIQSKEPANFAGQEISVAVASNFAEPIKIIAANFEKTTGARVIISLGSTGRHYAQIKNGAPFEIFLAADSYRPKLLEEENLAVAGSRFTYAVGRLILWSPRENYVDTTGKVLETVDTEYIAIANPKLAPYGMAAQEVLQALGQWERLQDHIVRGENIGQTYQFVKSGNADLGFVACSQVLRPGQPSEGSYWMIPQRLYTPIEQQAVLIKDTAAARAFLDYVRSPQALDIIQAYGYGTP